MDKEPIDRDREELGYWINVREEASRTLLYANKKIEEIYDHIIKKEAYIPTEQNYGTTSEKT